MKKFLLIALLAFASKMSFAQTTTNYYTSPGFDPYYNGSVFANDYYPTNASNGDWVMDSEVNHNPASGAHVTYLSVSLHGYAESSEDDYYAFAESYPTTEYGLALANLSNYYVDNYYEIDVIWYAEYSDGTWEEYVWTY